MLRPKSAATTAANLWSRMAEYATAIDVAELAPSDETIMERESLWREVSGLLNALPTTEVQTFDDVRALAWFVNQQLGAAINADDPVVICAAVALAAQAAERIAVELDASGHGPPAPGIPS